MRPEIQRPDADPVDHIIAWHDGDISTLTMHTSRGPMTQVDLKTFRAEGAPPVLRVVE